MWGVKVVTTGLSSPAPPTATTACIDTCRLQLVRKNTFQIPASVSSSQACLLGLSLSSLSLRHTHTAHCLPASPPQSELWVLGRRLLRTEPGSTLCLPQNLKW